jgi:hypothetical protein
VSPREHVFDALNPTPPTLGCPIPPQWHVYAVLGVMLCVSAVMLSLTWAYNRSDIDEALLSAAASPASAAASNGPTVAIGRDGDSVLASGKGKAE